MIVLKQKKIKEAAVGKTTVVVDALFRTLKDSPRATGIQLAGTCGSSLGYVLKMGGHVGPDDSQIERAIQGCVKAFLDSLEAELKKTS